MFRNNCGFTLIEFLVAIVILMVGLLGLLQAVNTGLVYNLNTQLRGEAVAVADRYLAREMTKSFDQISSPTSGAAKISGLIDSRPVLNGFKQYSVTKTLPPVMSNSKEVNITVSWRHKKVRYTQEASSVISKHQ